MIWLSQQKFSIHVPLSCTNTNTMVLTYYLFINLLTINMNSALFLKKKVFFSCQTFKAFNNEPLAKTVNNQRNK